VGVLALSVIFLLVGNRVASAETGADVDYYAFYSGVVTQIIDRAEIDIFVHTTFSARITRGARRGEVVTAEHFFSSTVLEDEKLEVGDRIVLVHDSFDGRYFFANFNRFDSIVVLGVAFLAIVILFGRLKGFNGIVALGFTCMAIFLVFVPAIISGRNIYVATIVVCVFSIVSTLSLVIGPNKKALSAMLGCFGGVLLAGVLMLIMDAVLGLSGVLDSETRNLLFLPTENPINLRALIFAGVILGAVGAIVDISMSIASSLWEVKEAGGVSDFASLFKSGINIGRDILGTMLNTLILAYIGSSLSLILVISVYSTSLLDLFNMEMIIVEFLRALVGSFGMLLTIPLTAAICGSLYQKRPSDILDDSADEEYRKRLEMRRAEHSKH